MTYHLGTLIFGGTILFETADETCVLLPGGWMTVRVPKRP